MKTPTHLRRRFCVWLAAGQRGLPSARRNASSHSSCSLASGEQGLFIVIVLVGDGRASHGLRRFEKLVAGKFQAASTISRIAR
jgi:hypothetical protein